MRFIGTSSAFDSVLIDKPSASRNVSLEFNGLKEWRRLRSAFFSYAPRNARSSAST